MMTFLQLVTAFFAVVGLFETVWQIAMLFLRNSARKTPIQIVISTDETTDPTFLSEDLRLLTGHLSKGENLRIWLVCPDGAPQEPVCRYFAQTVDCLRVVTPESLPDEVRAFAENL